MCSEKRLYKFSLIFFNIKFKITKTVNVLNHLNVLNPFEYPLKHLKISFINFTGVLKVKVLKQVLNGLKWVLKVLKGVSKGFKWVLMVLKGF